MMSIYIIYDKMLCARAEDFLSLSLDTPALCGTKIEMAKPHRQCKLGA